MGGLFSKALDFQNEHFTGLKWTYFVSHVVLIILTIAYIVCGAQATSLDLFHSDMKFMFTDYVLSLVFFTLFYIACFFVCLCILAKSFDTNQNLAVGCYSFFIFVFGFVLMAAEGSGLAALEYVEMDDII